MSIVETNMSRVDLTLVHPELAARVIRLLAVLRSQGKEFFVIEGYRSASRSALLWTYGRTQKNPDWKGEGLGPIVTKAKPFESPHAFGLAVDLVLDKDQAAPGLQPDWGNEAFCPLGPVAAEVHLIWGGDWAWKDRPHLNLPGYTTAADLAPLTKIWQSARGTPAERLQAVWKEVQCH